MVIAVEPCVVGWPLNGEESFMSEEPTCWATAEGNRMCSASDAKCADKFHV